MLVRVFSDVLVAFTSGKYQNMEKPLKYEKARIILMHAALHV